MAARIVVTEFVSLDGVMEAPGGEPDFKYPGWTFDFDRGDDGNQFKLEETKQADAMLIGRVTYESFAGAWPNREGEFADKFNSMAKYVVSATLEDPEWNNTTVIRDDIAGQIQKLRDEPGGDILVNGSAQLVELLVENGLVDEYRLMVFPTVLGDGKRLFGDTSAPAALRLVESRPAGETVILIYA